MAVLATEIITQQRPPLNSCPVGSFQIWVIALAELVNIGLSLIIKFLLSLLRLLFPSLFSGSDNVIISPGQRIHIVIGFLLCAAATPTVLALQMNANIPANNPPNGLHIGAGTSENI